MVDTPSGVWVSTGTAREAERRVASVTRQAEERGAVPLLVPYHLPFRDGQQYSAGGATSVAEYQRWIDGVAAGIGERAAVVALEPDSLGIIPWYTARDGSLEWCRPAEADPQTAAADRFAMLNHAVDRLTALQRTSVYLDGTHSGWLPVAEVADRLLRAGVGRADGFFLNASNFGWTANQEQYGSWISGCLAYVTRVAPGDFASCGDQYWSGGPANGWTGVALDDALVWSDTAREPTANTAGINSRYAALLCEVRPTTRFVVDTSRNGRGPWTPTGEQAAWPDPEVWCNPPGRGLGARPSTGTGTALAAGYLWIKTPGESDGPCRRGLATGAIDPAWGRENPPAGHWFDQQALELTALADPPLEAGPGSTAQSS